MQTDIWAFDNVLISLENWFHETRWLINIIFGLSYNLQDQEWGKPYLRTKKKTPLKYVWSFHRCPAKDSLCGNGAGQVKYCESSVFDGWLNNISPVALKKMYGSLEIINKIMSSYSALNVMILFCVVCWGRSAWDTKAAILHVKTPACNVINNRIYD